MTTMTLPLKYQFFYVCERSTVYFREIKRTNPREAGPFVKWAGGKSKLIDIILYNVSNHIDLNEMKHYIEPFIGGGAMFFYVANRYRFETMTIMDINLDLINTYRAIKENPIHIIREMDVLQNRYNELKTFQDKGQLYYEIRDIYNNYSDKDNLSDYIDFKRAAQFIFLNKSSFNGLYRVNRSGRYNVSFGKKEFIKIYNERNIICANKVLQRTSIVSGDFRKTLDYVQDNTFVYFDPPYRPITNSAGFTAYTESGFNDEEQKKLALLCLDLFNKGVRFAVSNSDPHNINPTDMFFNDLYNKFEIYRISAARQISAKAKSRNALNEILVIG